MTNQKKLTRIANAAVAKYCEVLEFDTVWCKDNTFRLFHSATEQEHIYDIYCRIVVDGVHYVRKISTIDVTLIMASKNLIQLIEANNHEIDHLIDEAYGIIYNNEMDIYIPSYRSIINEILHGEEPPQQKEFPF